MPLDSPAGDSSPPLTESLLRAAQGRQADRSLLDRVYRELHTLAQHYMAGERQDHTLQPTALVHEAFLKLFGDGKPSWQNRAQFYSAAARAMRHILVDHARSRQRIRRGGGRRRLPDSVLQLLGEQDSAEILALEEALQRLEASDPLGASIVQLRFYAGLSVEETARTLGLSVRTVYREWSYARAWLYRRLQPEG